MQKPERLRLLHAAANPAALDSAVWGAGVVVMRVAPDEVLALTDIAPDLSSDPHAVVRPDHGYAAVWLADGQARQFLARHCEWAPPRLPTTGRSAFAQGAVAGLPLKLWFEHDRVLILVPAPFATDLEERML